MGARDESLGGLRRAIDDIDDRLHDLLMRRTALVERVRAVKAEGGLPPLNPAREAAVLRRRLAYHRGPFPRASLVRIWREIIAAMVRLQAPLRLAVHAPAGDRAVWDLARDHFGTPTPAQAFDDGDAVIAAVLADPAVIGVLPWPGRAAPWWRRLALAAASDSAAPRIFAALPAMGGAPPRGLAVGRAVLAASGADRGLLAVVAPAAAPPAALADALAARGLAATPVDAAPHPTAPDRRMHLFAVAGFVAADDPRLAADPAHPEIAGVTALGVYAVIAPGDAETR